MTPAGSGPFIGLNSGTSMDGVDAALVRFEAGGAKILATHHRPYPDGLLALLRDVAAGAALPAGELGRLDAALGHLFGTAALEVLAAGNVTAGEVLALGCHGQTVYHGPTDDPASTLQLGDPNTVAELTGIDTVADLRRRDLASGGQGAPLAPALHAALFRSPAEDRAVLNLGGIANLTLLPADPAAPVTGFDTGPGNCLLDAWIRECSGRPFDRDGAWGASGTIDQGLLEALRRDAYFRRAPPKSTGVETFHLDWVRTCAAIDGPAAADVQATLAELTAATVAEGLRASLPGARRLLVCGGGASNHLLMARLAALLPGLEVVATDAHGLPARWVEVVLFAFLAREAHAGRTLDLTAVTGAARPLVYGTVFRA